MPQARAVEQGAAEQLHRMVREERVAAARRGPVNGAYGGPMLPVEDEYSEGDDSD